MSHSGLEVLLNGKLQTLHSVGEAQRVKVPNCKIMYHEMEASPEEKVPGMFKCIRQNNVWFSPAKDSQEVQDAADPNAKTNQVGAAKLLPNSVWYSDIISILFSVRWGPNGLIPVRPQVVLLSDLKLAAGQACKLSN